MKRKAGLEVSESVWGMLGHCAVFQTCCLGKASPRRCLGEWISGQQAVEISGG